MSEAHGEVRCDPNVGFVFNGCAGNRRGKEKKLAIG